MEIVARKQNIPSAMNRLLGNESQTMYDPETGMGGMSIPKGGERDVIEIFRGTIAGSTPQVAGKELIQNGLDAAAMVPNGRVKVKYNETNRIIEVEDNGPGLTIERIWTDYLDLTGSGKRGGERKTIGELGVGKIGYLTKGERFDFRTVVREEDGQLYEHKFSATPDDVLDHKIKIDSSPVPEGTQTGVWTHLLVPEGAKWFELDNYIESLKKHSRLQVPIEISKSFPRFSDNTKFFTNEDIISPKTPMESGKLVGEGYSPGGHYKVSIPKDVGDYLETDKIQAILVSRGMFQGVQTIYTRRKAKVPEKLIIEIEPTVRGTHPEYPLTTPTRESMKPSTFSRVWDLIDKEIIDGAAKTRELELERTFHQIVPEPGKKFVIVDPQAKFTPEEIALIANSKELEQVARTSRSIVEELRAEFNDELPSGKKIYSSGYILDDEVRGMNVRNPNEKLEHSILLNPINILRNARNPAEAAESFLHVTLHEFTHMLAWEEGAGFTSAFANVYPRYGARRLYNAAVRFEKALTEGTGQYTEQVSEILRRGKEAQGRTGSKAPAIITEAGSRLPETRGFQGVQSNARQGGADTLRNIPQGRTIVIPTAQATPVNIKKLYDAGFRFLGENDQGQLRFKKTASPGQAPILEEEIGGVRPTRRGLQGQLGAVQDAQKQSAVAEAFNFSRGVMASTDMSAPLRQGLPLIHKKEFWKALRPLWDSWRTEEGFQASQAAIANRPLFKKRVDPITGKVLPSFADDCGLKLTDLTDLTNREEAIMSTWAETGGFVEGKTRGIPVVSEAYSKTFGKMVRRSNRAYTSFLNNLRADVFENLIKDSGVLVDVKNNIPLSREIAGFVNTATGRGHLGKLEQSAVALNTGLFAPRLIASRLRILNPGYYIMASPFVRKEALKSLFALTAAGNTVLQLAKLAGAKVGTDPNSADFGKAIIGKVRIDPWGGFQQYIVAANRLIRPGFAAVPGMEGGTSTGVAPLDLTTGFLGGGGQRVTSSTTGKRFDLWKPKKGPYDPTHATVLGRFARGKVNPVIGFGISMASGFKEMSGKSMNFRTTNPFENSITQRFIPILVQDVYELAKEEPRLLPLAIPAGFGMGIQVYGDQ